ncbi:MAG: sulfatase-like hydrolase/transferase, partial [Pirellulaceae bacterium]|nr:sulfatase-like hydrolase/transferase [Pirellulaceae bacterium]
FCYVPFNAPHSPFQAPQKYLEQYKSISAGDTANDEKKQQRYRRTKQTLAAMITCMDDGVGRILQAIDDAGVRDNTVVWFFSDNGGVRAIKENNLPLRGDKLSVFEGGVRVPASVRWPAVLQAGSKVSAPIGNIDVLPTVMKMAGAESHGGKRLDGVNVLPWLKGQQQPLRRDLFFYHGQQGEQQELIAVSTPEWKLVVLGPNVAKSDFRSPQHRRFLFAINDDPLEKENLVDEHPDVVGQLAKRLAAFRKLQPQSAVPVYGRGKANFKAPKNWRIPDR